jgi:hypothetical protein
MPLFGISLTCIFMALLQDNVKRGWHGLDWRR